jgi:hypothetical protein
MEDLYTEDMSRVRLEGKADQAHMEALSHGIDMCPYYEKVKCHFPRLCYGFCSGCPKIAPDIASAHLINSVS